MFTFIFVGANRARVPRRTERVFPVATSMVRLPLPAFAPGHSEATPRPQAVDEAERYLLVLRFLEGSPCTAAFEALKREAAEHGLLGSRTDWTGASRPTSYERELDRRAPNLPSEHLSQLLDMVQRLSREREPVETRLSAAPRSLLRQGTLSLVEPCAAMPAGPRALASRNEHLPRTSLAWSARLSPAVPLPDMLRRGDRVGWLGLGQGLGLRVLEIGLGSVPVVDLALGLGLGLGLGLA